MGVGGRGAGRWEQGRPSVTPYCTHVNPVALLSPVTFTSETCYSTALYNFLTMLYPFDVPHICRMNVVRSTCAGQVIKKKTQLVVRRPGMWPSSLIHREAGQHGQVADDIISDKSRSF